MYLGPRVLWQRFNAANASDQVPFVALQEEVVELLCQ